MPGHLLPSTLAETGISLGLAALYALIAWTSGSTIDPSPLSILTLGILFVSLNWASVVDLREMRLPDVYTAAILGAGLLSAARWGGEQLAAAALASAIGYLALWTVAAAYRRWRGREGLGLGDAKLVGAAGAWVGIGGLASVVLIGSLTALAFIVGKKVLRPQTASDTPFPFGPFLALGIWVVWWWGPLALFGTV